MTDDLPSKSQRKRDMTALQELGEILVNLPTSDLAKIPLEEKLLEAIQMAKTLHSHGAKRRQLQYIGRLMRHVDTAPIHEALDKIQGKSQQETARFHQLERWREKLIAEGDEALADFINHYPETDHQQLRQLIRQAQKDTAAGKNTGASTELFRFLREVTERC